MKSYPKRARWGNKYGLVHGHNQRSSTGRSPTYLTYWSMIGRCYSTSNASYKYYGARGIRVCARWKQPRGKGFLNFLEDMGVRPEGKTLNRKSNHKAYSPSNCNWATPKEQRANRTDMPPYTGPDRSNEWN